MKRNTSNEYIKTRVSCEKENDNTSFNWARTNSVSTSSRKAEKCFRDLKENEIFLWKKQEPGHLKNGRREGRRCWF